MLYLIFGQQLLLLKIFTFIAFWIYTINGFCQQWNHISMTAINPYKDHSAYAGFDRQVTVVGHTRNQWVNHLGSPSHQYIGIHMPIYFINAGAGMDFQNISEGSFNYRSIRFSANKVLVSKIGALSFSGRVGLHNISIDGNTIRTPEGDYLDGVINHNDLILSSSKTSAIGIGWEISSFFRNQVFQGGITFQNTPSHFIAIEKVHYKLQPSISAFFSTIFSLTDNINFQPSIVIRTDFLQVQTEINSLFNLNGNIFGGIMLRGYNSSTFDALGLSFGHKLNKKYAIFYAYDFPISDLRTTNEGSHELMLKLSFDNFINPYAKPRVTYNPRFIK